MHKELPDKVLAFIKKNELIKPHDKIVVGLSGGPDSIFLLTILDQLKSDLNLTLIAAHLDHMWRPNSQDDMQFCKSIAKKHKITFVTKKAQEIELKRKPESQEELGRLLRRQFFEQVLREYNADSIVLGHHQDDQEETFFIRLLRGASLTGLAGMRPQNGHYIRPLLSITKAEILDYLSHHKIEYMTDYTNELDLYLRNKIRKYVLPALKKVDPRFDKNLIKAIQHIQSTDQFLDQLAQNAFQEISISKNSILYLDKEKFLTLDPFLYPRIIILWLTQARVPFVPSDKFFNEIVRFIKQKKSQKHQLYPTWAIHKTGNLLQITPTD